ncbi:MAG: cupin domain-containing protein [Spartobacteria bacterium]
MRKINAHELKEYSWSSPKAKFGGAGIDLSEALGWDPQGAEARARHPFAVEILRLAPEQTPYPYHSHAAQWEFYHVISGRGVARDESGRTPIVAGDAFIYGPGEPHQLTNDSTDDLVIYVVADNPLGESCYYPDSRKWLVRSPERTLLRADNGTVDYYLSEE